jgi:hypothetical protein
MKSSNAFVVVLLVLFAVGIGAQENAEGLEVGEIIYVDGPVSVFRDGERLFDEIDFGFVFESYDFVQTAAGGIVEIQLYPETGVDAILTLQPNTAMYLDLSAVADGGGAGIEAVTGSMAVDVSRLLRGTDLDLRTETANMGVRGTVFEVDVAPTGDVLVTASEGRVEVTTEEGDSYIASEGIAVEGRVNAPWRNREIDEDSIARFREQWLRDVVADLRQNAVRVFRRNAIRYNRLKDQFNDLYESIVENREIVTEWIRADRQASILERMQITQAVRELRRDLSQARRRLFLLERLHYRIAGLSRFYSQGFGAGRRLPGFDPERFFESFEDERELLEERMHMVRYVFKLYRERTGERIAPSLFGTN